MSDFPSSGMVSCNLSSSGPRCSTVAFDAFLTMKETEQPDISKAFTDLR